MYNEMLEVLGPSGPVDAEQLKQLHYLDMVLLETVRYFPAAVLIQRTVLEDISIDNGMLDMKTSYHLFLFYAREKSLLILVILCSDQG